MAYPMTPEHAALVDQQTALKQKLTRAHQHVIQTKTALENSNGHRGVSYDMRAKQYAQAKQAVLAITAELQAINGKVKTANVALSAEENADKRQMHLEERRRYINEFDFKNQLFEPQDLLRRATVALERATARLGRTDAERAIIDSAQDYLRRHGIQL